MTQISTTANLLRLLREDPDFRDQVRSLLLTQELIDLPERFARFEANVEQQLAEISADLSKNTGDLGRLKGADYERRVGRSFAGHASRAFRERHGRSLRRNRLLVSSGFGMASEYEELIADAVDVGLTSEDEWIDLQQADAVMSGQDQGETVYYVGEFSVTINNIDIDRAIARAAILSKATGSDAWPMVIGENMPSPQRDRATVEQVAFREVEQ